MIVLPTESPPPPPLVSQLDVKRKATLALYFFVDLGVHNGVLMNSSVLEMSTTKSISLKTTTLVSLVFVLLMLVPCNQPAY